MILYVNDFENKFSVLRFENVQIFEKIQNLQGSRDPKKQ